MAQAFTLYHYWRSSCSWRLRWALLHKGVSYTSKTINLLQGEHLSSAYKAINPAGNVPCLRYGDLTMTESLAILEWLEDRFPAKPLLPQDADMRFRCRQLALTVVAGTQPIQNLKVLKYISKDQEQRSEFAKHWISEGLAQYEALLTHAATAGTYSLGATITLADLCLVPQVYNAKRFAVDLTPFPHVERIYTSCLKLVDCQKSSPEMQPDAVK